MSCKAASNFAFSRSRFVYKSEILRSIPRAMSSIAPRPTLSDTNSLPRIGAKQNLSTLMQSVQIDYLDEHTKALADAIEVMTEQDQTRRDQRANATAYEIAPFHVRSAADLARDASVDKVVICIRHGEAEHNSFEREWKRQGKDINEAIKDEEYPRDPVLTKRGFGQALDISRKISDCCNRDTNLMPELVVVSPLKRATLTALLSFPQHSPLSVRNTKWVCHPALMEMTNGNPADEVSSVEELSRIFPGIDYTLLEEDEVHKRMNGIGRVPRVESKLDLLARTDSFLSWLKNREERVIVLGSHSTWLQSFCGFSMDYEPREYGMEPFRTGEMRCLAVKFQE